MIVKMFDLARDHEEIKSELLKITDRILTDGDYILGKG